MLAEIEGVKLITCDELPGVRPPGHWPRVVSAFMESNEPHIRVHSTLHAHTVQSSLGQAIRKAKLDKLIYATVRQRACYLVRIGHS